MIMVEQIWIDSCSQIEGVNRREENKVQQWCFQAQQHGKASVIESSLLVNSGRSGHQKHEMEMGYKEDGETDG